MVCNATRKSSHGVGKQSRCVDVCVPFSIAVIHKRAPCGHDAPAERIDGKATLIIPVREQRTCNATNALKVARTSFRIERRHEVVYLNQRRGELPERPVWRHARSGEAFVDSLHLVI